MSTPDPNPKEILQKLRDEIDTRIADLSNLLEVYRSQREKITQTIAFLDSSLFNCTLVFPEFNPSGQLEPTEVKSTDNSNVFHDDNYLQNQKENSLSQITVASLIKNFFIQEAVSTADILVLENALDLDKKTLNSALRKFKSEFKEVRPDVWSLVRIISKEVDLDKQEVAPPVKEYYYKFENAPGFYSSNKNLSNFAGALLHLLKTNPGCQYTVTDFINQTIGSEKYDALSQKDKNKLRSKISNAINQIKASKINKIKKVKLGVWIYNEASHTPS